MTNRVEDLKRKTIRMLRSRINLRRRFSVKHISPYELEYTCRTCGTVTVKDYSFKATGKHFSPGFLEKLAPYQESSGATGICEVCTRKRRDELHPYAAKEKGS